MIVVLKFPARGIIKLAKVVFAVTNSSKDKTDFLWST